MQISLIFMSVSRGVSAYFKAFSLPENVIQDKQSSFFLQRSEKIVLSLRESVCFSVSAPLIHFPRSVGQRCQLLISSTADEKERYFIRQNYRNYFLSEKTKFLCISAKIYFKVTSVCGCSMRNFVANCHIIFT